LAPHLIFVHLRFLFDHLWTTCQQCPREVGSRQTEGWKQRRQEKLWKKVSSFVLSPAFKLPDPFGLSSSLHAFCITGTYAHRFMCACLTDISIRDAKHVIGILSPSVSHGHRSQFRSLRVSPTPVQNGTTAGVRGKITRFVTTIHTASSTYHFYELEVHALDPEWLECKERQREWVDYGEALRRISWKKELAQGLKLSSMAPS
jgi:hypothetical protein